jgi:hypothetical protein
MFVYAVRGGGYIKIGVSDDMKGRLAKFNGGILPFTVRVVCLGETDTARAIEAENHLLDILPGRCCGEWFDGSITDDEIASAFKVGSWDKPVLIKPTPEQLAEAYRNSALRRQLGASRRVAELLESREARVIDWRKIATELSTSGDVRPLRKIKKAFKKKRLIAQNRAK